MKKIKYLILIIVIMFITTIQVNAASITKVTYNDVFKVEGKGTGIGQVQIVLFNSSNEPIYMTTAYVTDNKFSITFPKIDDLKVGDYKMKVADYDGNNVSTELLSFNGNTVISKNPTTTDKVMSYIILGILSVISLGSCKLYLNKKKRSN